MRARVLALALALVPLGARIALAEGEVRDYRPDSPAWNGLSGFVAEAQALGCAISPADNLDWRALGPRDVLFFVYPQSSIDPEALGEYLARGGRLLLADDFGAAAPAFAALQLQRTAARLDGVKHEPGHPELPVAEVRLLTAIGRSTGRLVANHPAAFETVLPPTFSFSAGQALVVEGRVGPGRFVALADPSVLINNMLELEPNRAFARAVLGELCVPGPSGDRVHLLTGPFRAPPLRSHAGAQGAGLQQLNEHLARANRATEELVQGELALPIALLLCCAAVGLAWSALSRPRGARHVDASFVRADGHDRKSPAALVDALPRGAGSDADHALALLMLRAEVMRAISARLAKPVAANAGREELLRRIGVDLGDDVREAAARFFSTGPSGAGAVSRRTFVRALAFARPILARSEVIDVDSR